ncbi:hypothetical protein ACP26L_25710 [Paenibacillus sp. S-38]|uniref:hypothetical protein n=1 Tax=Paenibacillus sp. S-38 TaxID=3416710 RepID=UPI003CE75D6E
MNNEQVQELKEGLQVIISQGLVLQLVKVSELQEMADTIERQAKEIKRLSTIEQALQDYFPRETGTARDVFNWVESVSGYLEE